MCADMSFALASSAKLVRRIGQTFGETVAPQQSEKNMQGWCCLENWEGISRVQRNMGLRMKLFI